MRPTYATGQFNAQLPRIIRNHLYIRIFDTITPKYMKTFCLDANIFFAFQKGIGLGENPVAVVRSLAETKSAQAVFFMPPRVVEELLFLADPETKQAIQGLLTKIIIQSPAIHDKTIGTQVLYDFVEEARQRSLRGLHVAETALEQAACENLGKTSLGKIEFQKSLQPVKEGLRNRYRNATRTGFIDSIADLDLIFLAKEEDAYLVSADEGLLQWGRKLGVKEMSLGAFGETIRTVTPMK